VIVAGFDTATPSTVVGVLLDDGRVVEARDDPQDGGRGAHASRLLVLAEQALAGAGAGWEDVGRLAVGVGPGGFTGLRIGIATARAISQARDLPLVPVSSLAALAAGAMPADEAPPPLVAAVIDARRGEVFAAVYRGLQPVMEPVALAPAVLAERLLALDEPVQAVGDGAVGFRPELEGAGVAVPADGASVHRIGAGPLCRLGLVAEPAERDALLPDYRREPDAKPPTR
jgi:tRNA threonylcarbamoyladenosine biosynthesis protein TsaB